MEVGLQVRQRGVEPHPVQQCLVLGPEHPLSRQQRVRPVVPLGYHLVGPAVLRFDLGRQDDERGVVPDQSVTEVGELAEAYGPPVGSHGDEGVGHDVRHAVHPQGGGETGVGVTAADAGDDVGEAGPVEEAAVVVLVPDEPGDHVLLYVRQDKIESLTQKLSLWTPALF